MGTTYDTDFYDWAMQQAALLRAGRLADADIENIAEEIESMGWSEKRELVSRLTLLLLHLLKWQAQPTGRCTSWRLTIDEQRDQVDSRLHDNPSLQAKLAECTIPAYRSALRSAARETGLDVSAFPPACPWSFADIAAAEFWPG